MCVEKRFPYRGDKLLEAKRCCGEGKNNYFRLNEGS